MDKYNIKITKKDKEKALEYIKKVNEILNKYPYISCPEVNTVPIISLAKDYAKDTEIWISRLSEE
mgnify:CR=1 FL=1